MDFTSWHGKLVTGDRRICRKRCDPLCFSSASPKGCDEHTLYNTRARARAHAREHARAHESLSFYIIYEKACPEASLKALFRSDFRTQRAGLLEHSWRTSGTFMNVCSNIHECLNEHSWMSQWTFMNVSANIHECSRCDLRDVGKSNRLSAENWCLFAFDKYWWRCVPACGSTKFLLLLFCSVCNLA